MYIHLTLLGSDLLGILTSGLTSLTRLGLDVKVDEEKDGEEGAEKDGKVGTELNLKSNSVGGHSLNDGVHGESRGGEGGDRDGSDGGLGGDCGWVRRKWERWASEIKVLDSKLQDMLPCNAAFAQIHHDLLS